MSGYASSDNGFDRRVLDDMTDMLVEDRHEVFLPAVQALVNAIGGYEEVPSEDLPGVFTTIYRPGDSVLPVLKDLKKLWRKDDTDDERTVARCMAQAGLMKELIALVKECTFRGDWGRKVSLMACDLIAALTWPIDVAQELKEMWEEGEVVTDYASLLHAQVLYKAHILQGDTLQYLLALLLPCFGKSRRDDKDERIISLGLHIVRNLLAIRDVPAPDSATGNKAYLSSLQSKLVVQLNKLTYLDLFITLASGADKGEFNPYNVLVLDILHLIFRSVSPQELSKDQAKAPIENLSRLLEEEQRVKAVKAINLPSRHSRFGTTITVRGGETKVVLHSQSAVQADPALILDEVKRKKAPRVKKIDDLTVDANMSQESMVVLQNFAKEFLETCFNVFIDSILRDIRMERSKVRPADSIRTLFLSRFGVEYLLALRKKALAAAEANSKPEDDETEQPMVQVDRELPLGLVGVMAELDSVRWVVSRMKISMDDKPPAWTELQASIDCFSQILLVLDAMSLSSDEEDTEVAEILQNQLYYNGDILEASLQVVSQYKNQSIGYLESVVQFAYVLLRMLERYSKNKAFMFVRRRKAARKKRQDLKANTTGEAPIPEEYINEEDEEENEPDRDAPSYSEHKFQFAAFEKRFAQESVCNTLLAYLEQFHSFFDADKIRRVTGLMHRQVVKAQAEGLYFKVSSLHLFRRILDHQASLPRGEATRDLVHLITFILRKFFKRMEEDPFLIVEALTPKSGGKWKEASSYESDDEGKGGAKAGGSGELEFVKKKNLSWSQQMGVVVAMLIEAGHRDWIAWIIEVLEIVVAMRIEIVLSVDGEQELVVEDSDGERAVRNFAGPSKEAVDKFAQYDLDADTSDRRTAVRENAHMRLMLRLLNFDMTDGDIMQQAWFLPSSVIPSTISTCLGALKQFLEDPPALAEDPKALLRRARKPRVRSASDVDSDGEPRPPRRRKEKEVQVFKSAAFIYDSDDDEDADAAFFAREEQLRREMEELAQSTGTAMRATGTKKRKRKGAEENHVNADEVESIASQDDDERMDVQEEGAGEDGGDADDESDDEPPRQRRRTMSMGSVVSHASGDSDAGNDNEVEVTTTQRRRAPRIVDSDSD